MTNIIVISDGDEISFAKPFIDLYKMQIDDSIIKSSKGNKVNVGLFSTQSFLHSSIAKNSIKVII